MLQFFFCCRYIAETFKTVCAIISYISTYVCLIRRFKSVEKTLKRLHRTANCCMPAELIHTFEPSYKIMCPWPFASRKDSDSLVHIFILIRVRSYPLIHFINRAINEGYRNGKLSVKKGQGLIICLPKGDKPGQFLKKNWLPVTLLNVMYEPDSD